MTEHDKHMEVYATAILGTLRIIANTLIEAADAQNWVRHDTWANLVNGMSKISTEADKITELRNKVIDAKEPDAANKYLKLYKDSEDMRKKCLQVISIMDAKHGVEEDDDEAIAAWSVIKCASGRVLVTVDYYESSGDLVTYQFPVAWLDLTKKELAERKVGCQLV